jgi:hypothetical protein
MKVTIRFKDGTFKKFDDVMYIEDGFDGKDYKKIAFDEMDLGSLNILLYEIEKVYVDKIKSISIYEEY